MSAAANSALRAFPLAALVIALLGIAAPGAAADGVVPGSFSYKLHATVPLRQEAEELAPFQRLVNVAGLFEAPFATQAGEHADLSVTSGLRVSGTNGVLNGTEIPEETVTELPPGPVLDLRDVPTCPHARFLDEIAERPSGCPVASQVGVASIIFGGSLQDRSYPLYKLAPAHGHIATFGFPYELLSQPVGVLVNADLRASGDYGLTLSTSGISFAKFAPAPFLTLWGVPAAAAHDPERWDPQTLSWGESLAGPETPLVANGADCEAGGSEARLRLRYWADPEQWLPADPEDPAYRSFTPQLEGCDRLPFAPQAEISTPEGGAGSPGFELHLRMPRDPDPGGLETPSLASASLELPEGISVNPASADGLAGCTPEEIGLETDGATESVPVRFGAAESECPAAAKIGTGSIETPLAEGPLAGDIYFATPFHNPFGSPLALYLVFPGPGFTAKLAVDVEADPSSGRLIASLSPLPQLPVDSVRLSLAGGPRTPLTPAPGCGEGSFDLSLAPWSAPSSPVRIASRYSHAASSGPGCREASPSALTAGTTDPAAGAWSSFVLSLHAAEMGAFELRLPPGLLARVGGVQPCGQAEIEEAEAREEPGGGEAERAEPSCPEGSRVGSLRIDAGAGPVPLPVTGGLYLAGPYRGAPFSLVAIVPALAGGSAADPLFDLGTVVDRVALAVDPHSGALSAAVDAPPATLAGVPLQVSAVSAVLDRAAFVRNPSSCANMAIAASLQSAEGTTTVPESGFRVSGCEHLRFAPRLRLVVTQGRRHGAHPAVKAVLQASPDEAALAAAHLSLPPSVQLDPRRLATGTALRGHVTAWSDLLGERLEGPVYLRSAEGRPAELVLALAGQPGMELTGQVRARQGRVRIDFAGLPDAQLTKLVVSLSGGGRGFLVNARDLCASPSDAIARLVSPGGIARVRRTSFGGPCAAAAPSRPGTGRPTATRTEER